MYKLTAHGVIKTKISDLEIFIGGNFFTAAQNRWSNGLSR